MRGGGGSVGFGAGAPAPDEAVVEEVLAGGTQEVGEGTAGAWGNPDDGGAVAPEGAVSGQRAVRGAVVTVTAQGAKMGIQVLSVIVLARLLSPQDYGLIAMVVAVIGVADIFRDFGLSSSAIQASTLSRAEQVNLFWVNTLIGVVLAVCAAAASPLVALLYGHPELRAITVALAVNFLLNGMATQYRADLNRRMMFTRLAVADVLAPALGLVAATVLALGGAGFWALVAQQVTQALVVLVLVAIGARWLPGRYRRDVSVRPFLRFGVRLVGSQLVNYVGSNIDTVMLGLRGTPASLGLYNRAYQLVMTTTGQIRAPLNTVAVPVLSRMQDDEQRFQMTVARAQRALGYTLVVALAVMAGTAAPLVITLLGSQWVGATPVLRLLAVAAGLQTLSFVGYWVYVTKGLVGHLLNYTFISTGIRVALVVAGSTWGLPGVATAMAVAPAIAWPLSFWWLSRRACVPVRELWRGGVRISAFAGLVGAAAYGGVLGVAAMGAGGSGVGEVGVGEAGLGLSGVGLAWVQLGAGVGCAVLAFAVIGWLIPVYRRDLRDVWGLIRLGLRRSPRG